MFENSITFDAYIDSNPREERWEGKRISPDAAKDYYGVDDAYYLCDLKKCLDDYLKEFDAFKSGTKNVAVWYDFDHPTNEGVHEVLKNLKNCLAQNSMDKCITQSPR